MLNKDYKEMLQILLDNEVRFLVVGAYAMAAHGYPRATGDIDIWIEPSSANSIKVRRALEQFGSPLAQIEDTTFLKKGIIYQIGVPPRRIDIITAISGADFLQAYRRRKKILIEGLKLPFLSKADLIKNKGATGRDKDKLDVKYLKSAPKE